MGKTILIVDDSASMRQMVSFTLRDAGYAVVDAVDGMDGLSKSASVKADVVLTDLNMPNLDGIGMIRGLRSTPAYKFTPIVMLTTESQESKKMEGRKAGASAWIVKPFKPEQLVDLVKRFAR